MSVSAAAVQNGATPGTITIAPFSFASGGSTYHVTADSNGTLIGTKDGQAWKTWQLYAPNAASLFPAPGASVSQTDGIDEKLPKVDISA